MSFAIIATVEVRLLRTSLSIIDDTCRFIPRIPREGLKTKCQALFAPTIMIVPWHFHTVTNMVGFNHRMGEFVEEHSSMLSIVEAQSPIAMCVTFLERRMPLGHHAWELRRW